MSNERKNLKQVIEHFTPSWFSVTMGTGILSILIHNFPFPFRGLWTIALVFYSLNVAIFILFSLLTLTRYILFPTLLQKMLRHPTQSLFVGTLPMGLITLTNFSSFLSSDLAFILWVIALGLTAFSLLVIPYHMVLYHTHQLETMNGTWLLPIVPAIVTAASGGLLAQTLPLNRAIVVLTISWPLMGVGLSLALSIIVIYLCRLMLYRMPAKEVMLSSFLPLGPLGQGSYGLIQLGLASERVWGVGKEVGVMGGLGLWGYGVWYLLLASLTVARGPLPFNMGWWALTFPLGVLTAATLSLGQVLEMLFFDVLGAILTGVLVLVWFYVMTLTVKGAVTREMFYAPCLTPVTS